VPFTHYPKLSANVIFACVQPAPPDKPNFLGHPRFSTLNRFKEPLAPGKSVVGYQEALNFTRFFGTIACDQKLLVIVSFSNDEVAADGHWVTDDNIHDLNYDAVEREHQYEPSKQGPTGKFIAIILGRWLKVEVKNVGDTDTKFLRVYVRGSVF
jgi:hypothetical protein